MSKTWAGSLLESVKSFKNVKNGKPSKKEEFEDDDSTSIEDGDDITPQQDQVQLSDLEKLEQKIAETLMDLGLTACEASQDEDGSIYVDLSFEDNSNASLELSVNDEGTGMMYLLTDDSGEPTEEVELPAEMVVDNKVSLSNLDLLPVDELKAMFSDVVTVDDETEGYRRNDGIGECVTVKKKRITEAKWITKMIKKRKVENRKK